MSLQRRRERYAIIHVWKIIKGLAPNDINIESYEHIRLGVRCRVPPLPRRAPACAKSIYDSLFAVTGPKLWNILPRSVTCAPSLESFKSRLTSHIMGSYPDLRQVGRLAPDSLCTVPARSMQQQKNTPCTVPARSLHNEHLMHTPCTVSPCTLPARSMHGLCTVPAQ